MRVWWLLAATGLARPLADRTLVVIDANGAPVEDEAVRAPLEQRGHSVEVKAVRDGVELFELGERLYDNVLVVPGKTKGLGKGLSARAILEYLQDGGNFAVLTTPQSSPVSVRETAAQLGIRVAPRGVGLVDYFGAQPSEGAFEVPAVVAHSAINVEGSSVAQVDANGFAFGLIKSPATSYSYNKLESTSNEAAEPWSYGDGYVAAATQLRNNARFAWLGSAELLQSSAGNDILGWTFQEKGVLRVEGVSHNSSSGSHHVYKISEPITYCASIEEWNGKEWAAFEGQDVQLDFRMLDPYHRVFLAPTTEGKQCTTFTIPDQYGMFTFDLKYARRGLSYLDDEKLVTIRHTANDEWPRSWTITNSWVYISSALSVTAAWLLFVGIYFSA